MPEGASDHADTTRHGAPDMDDGMKMIWHHTELEHTDLRETIVEMEEALYQIFGERCLGDVGFGGVLFGDLQLTKDRTPTCCSKRHMIDTDTFPSRVWFLPMPCVMIIRHTYIRN